MADSLNTHNDELTNAEPAQHTAEMLEKAEQIERNNQGGDERPDWLPEKFNSVEDLANAYSQLEKRMGQGEEDAEIEDIQEEEAYFRREEHSGREIELMCTDKYK